MVKRTGVIAEMDVTSLTVAVTGAPGGAGVAVGNTQASSSVKVTNTSNGASLEYKAGSEAWVGLHPSDGIEIAIDLSVTSLLFRRSRYDGGLASASLVIYGSPTLKSAEGGLPINSGGGASDIAFSQAIPLISGGSAYMPQQNVAGPLTFALMASAVRNSLVYLRLVADGVNTPNFSAFKEWGGSLGYDNRAGIVNQVQFFYDGYDAYFTASQVVGATPIDVTAPTVSAAAVANATPTVVNVTMSEALDASAVPAASAFTVSGHTVSSVAISGSTVNVTVSAAFVNGEAARTLAYVQPASNGLRDAAGNLVASFSGLSITNNVAAVDVTAPVRQSLAMNGNSLTATYNETLNSAAPTLSSFALVVDGAASVAPTSASITGAVVTLGFAAAVTSGQVLSLSYTPGASAIRDTAGNNAASFSAQSVTNNTSASGATITRMTSLSAGAVESGDGTAGWNYTGTLAGLLNNAVCGNKSLPASADGSVQGRVNPTTAGIAMIGMRLTASATGGNDYTSFTGGMYAEVGGTNLYKVIIGGTVTVATTARAPAAGDIMRVSRVGTTFVYAVSSDNGSTWNTIHTSTGASQAVQYMECTASNAANSGTYDTRTTGFA